ncbi:DUF975 family protein [Miniphocaeibacter halophilus]|uniref:DUF975 family protein n=1 Tax=Miniphocaeibacter halophilus TaxID=2931922 RepID=A0AC61MUU4_9FIRM|nr:DUF975 family protein [Miniphocaeibacter halophilus]QQK08489.1 DUF975 family protein [Miniphocaeibacter halophilus]
MWTRDKLKFDAKVFLRKNMKNAILACLVFLIFASIISWNSTVVNIITDKSISQFNEDIINEELYTPDLLYNSEKERLFYENINEGEGVFSINLWNSIYNYFFNLDGNFLNNNLYIDFINGNFNFKMPSIILSGIISLFFILNIFFIQPLSIGVNKYFLKAYKKENKLINIFIPFKDGTWFKLSGKLFLMNLYLSLWTLLFIIPGVIKYFQYYYVEYILAENPEMPLSEAIGLSKEMTDGEKFDIFILQLSFIGWELLSLFTFSLGHLLLIPYTKATYTRLYLFKKEQFQIKAKYDYFDEIKN